MLRWEGFSMFPTTTSRSKKIHEQVKLRSSLRWGWLGSRSCGVQISRGQSCVHPRSPQTLLSQPQTLLGSEEAEKMPTMCLALT